MHVAKETPLSELWHRASEDWTLLESAASILEECKSAFLSQLMTSQGDMPVSKSELKAKSDPKWTEYLKAMVDARTKANFAKIKVEYLRMRFFEENSRAATERVAARL